MSNRNVKSHALGCLRAATSSIGLSCGRATLAWLICDMLCIVNDNHSFKKQVRRGTYRESENLLRSIDIW